MDRVQRLEEREGRGVRWVGACGGILPQPTICKSNEEQNKGKDSFFFFFFRSVDMEKKKKGKRIDRIYLYLSLYRYVYILACFLKSRIEIHRFLCIVTLGYLSALFLSEGV